ncbi:MAG: ubiquinol-cytochrome c reductase iron-sulfur subunit [Actinomycetota bacterium]
MSPLAAAALVVVVSLASWGGFALLAQSALRAKSAPAGGAAAAGGLDVPEPVPQMRVIEDPQDVSRRKFLNRGMGMALLISFGQFGLASLDFLYPRLRGGFGAKITVGDEESIREEIIAGREPKFIPDGRFYLAIYEGKPEDAESIPSYSAANVATSGLVAMYRKCVHLGCAVPWCPPAKWFECPCHGSKYSINGEYRDGPAPRGLDQFKVEIVGGKIVVDTSTIIEGAPRGTTTSQPQPEGAHCVDIREG